MATKCECCKGSGKQNLSVHEVTSTGTTNSTCKISCIWCKGTGMMTESQIMERRDYINAWCKCPRESRRPKFDGHDTFCETCGLLLMAG